MTANSTSSKLTGSDDGFARRRINDLAGLAAIIGTAFVVALITGVDTPVFAVALFAAVGALAYAEQRLTGAGPERSTPGGTMGRWQAQA